MNLVDQHLEVYREPRPDVDVDYGFSYSLSNIFKSDEQVTPRSVLDKAVAVADMLP